MRKGTKALLKQLQDKLPDMMRQWSPCNNAADYDCAFCHARASDNVTDIRHADDCLGKALERELAFI